MNWLINFSLTDGIAWNDIIPIDIVSVIFCILFCYVIDSVNDDKKTD